MSYDLPKPFEFKVGDIARPRKGVITARRMSDGWNLPITDDPRFRLVAIIGCCNDVVVEWIGGNAADPSLLIFKSWDLVKVPANDEPDDEPDDVPFDWRSTVPNTERRRWPSFPVGALVRLHADLNRAYSFDGTGCLYAGTDNDNAWTVGGGFVPANGSEPTISIAFGGVTKSFGVMHFEGVARDAVSGRLVPTLQHWTGEGETFSTPRTQEQIKKNQQQIEERSVRERKDEIRAKSKTLSYIMPGLSFDALRERATATGATLPLELDKKEPLDWSTGFDEHYDDHQPRSRRL